MFDEKRVELFSTIVAQLGVSLENIFINKNLESKVRQRTSELEILNKAMKVAKEETDNLLLNILPKLLIDIFFFR